MFLFVYLAASGLSCSTQDLSLLNTSSLVVAWVPEHVGSVVVVFGLSHCGAQAQSLQCSGSVVAVLRLSSCSTQV